MKKILIGLGLGLIVLGVVWWWKNNQPKIETRGEIQETRIEQKKSKRELFKFAVMADIHNDIDSLAKALEQARGELVILAGDLTIDGTVKEQNSIDKVMKTSGSDYFLIPGNHDLRQSNWILGKRYQTIYKDRVKLLLIDNGSWRGLGEEQKKWIETESGECRVYLCLVLMHMPLDHNFSKHVMGENSTKVTAEAEWLRNLLVKNGVKMGYSGHLHYTTNYTIDGWETVLVGAISKDRNTQTPRFTEVTVYDDGSVKNNVKLLMSNDK